MSLKYYDFMAERLVACDLELLDGALKRNFGKSMKDIVRQLEVEAAVRTSASPKGTIEFAYDRTPEMTTIIATANNHELPKVFTRLKRSSFGVWSIEVSLKPTCDKYDYGYVFHGCCFRGRSFAEKLAREIIRGVYSRLGKRRRHAANKTTNR